MNISIIGAGNMAHAIGTRMVAAEQHVTIYDRTLEKGKELAAKLGAGVGSAQLSDAVTGDVVIFALPYAATLEVVKAHANELAGKIVIDISNPIDFQTFELIPAAGSSGAEEIARLLPTSKVIKAFNTNFAAALIDGISNGKKTIVQIAGDDTLAKDALNQMIVKSGLEVSDEGPLSSARDLEKTAQENIRKMYSK